MKATRFTHVSISANDLEESVRFYTEVFGLERIPSPAFDIPVEWLRCGDQQLHLFERDVEAPPYHHFAFHVDDFEALYRTALERDLFDEYDDSDPVVYELPDGSVQTYLRDPTGNRIEVNWPDAERLSSTITDTIRKRSEMVPQPPEASRADLYMDS